MRASGRTPAPGDASAMSASVAPWLAADPASAPVPARRDAATVVTLTNAERTRAGLPVYRQNTQLMQAAQLHADQMAKLGRMDHVLRGARYPDAPDRLAAAGYQWSAYAENVAMGQRTPGEVLRSWMQSTGHRGNILSTNVTEMGAGYAADTAGRIYWVQVFGRP